MTIKEIIPNLNKGVIYNGSVYTLTGSIIRLTDNGLYYQAEIMDRNNNSVCIVRLEDITAI